MGVSPLAESGIGARDMLGECSVAVYSGTCRGYVVFDNEWPEMLNQQVLGLIESRNEQLMLHVVEFNVLRMIAKSSTN